MPMKEPYSPLAQRTAHPRDVRGEREHVYGIAYHTTGRGVVEKAQKARRPPLDVAVEHYTTGGTGFAHYVVGHAGETIQIAPESEPAWQTGWGKWERNAYRGLRLPWGKDWREIFAQDYVDDLVRVLPSHYVWWDVRWAPALPSPWAILKKATRLVTPPNPNDLYVGIEFLWHADGVTNEQYMAGARLILDIARRRKIPIGAPPNPSLLGHEDLCPCRRVTKSGRPWDPGDQVDLERLWAAILDAMPSGGVLDRDALARPWRGPA